MLTFYCKVEELDAKEKELASASQQLSEKEKVIENMRQTVS